MRRVLLGINLLIVLATAGALASPYTDPAVNKVPAMLSLLFPLFILANLVFLLGWIMAKNYAALLPLAALTLAWSAISGFIGFNLPSDTPEDAFRIASFNARHLLHIPDGSDRLDFLKKLCSDMKNPDVICIQEGGKFDTFAEDLGYPYTFRIPKSKNIFLSKVQIIRQEILDLSPDESYSAYFDIPIGSDTARVFLLYLTSNRITAKSEELFSDPQIRNKDTWEDGLGLVRSYVKKSRVRARQSRKIRATIDQSPYPVLVGGDLNDIPLSYSTNMISNGYLDAFRQKGMGLGTTYAGSIPGLRIDYIFADDRFEVLEYDRLRVSASDHYPIAASVRIKDL